MLKKYFLVLGALLAFGISNSQNEATAPAKYVGQLLDEQTKEPLAFAHVVVLGTKNGAVSNENGRFTITNISLKKEDTLSFFFVGYRAKKMSAAEFINQPTVYLGAETFSLNEFFVFADDKNAEDIVKMVLPNTGKNYKKTYTKEQVFTRDRNVADINHVEIKFKKSSFNQLSEKINCALLASQQSNTEIQLNDRDILIHCSPFLVDKHSDSGLMLTFSDITLIREQQREKNQLIDFLSHDVRSPLVSQLAMLDSINKGNETLSPELIIKLAAHAKRSLNLSDQFLQITRAEQTTEQQFYEFDLINTVENSIDALSAQAKTKAIHISFTDYDPIWINGNAELMERALTNLLSNSIKYSPNESSIKIEIEQKNETIKIDIIDQGYGIEVNELPHIFKRFHRQKSSELSRNKGTGLGLNFVKVVIDKHQGEIAVTSKKEKGKEKTSELESRVGSGKV